MSFHWRALFTSPGGLVRTRRGRRLLLSAVVLVAVYAIAGFFVLPAVLRGAIERIAREHYDVAAGIRELEINPFLLVLEARDVSASETSGAPLFGATRLVIDLDAASLWHRGWIISLIHTEGEWIELARERDGRFNLQRVFGKGSGPASDGAKPPRVLLRRIEIERGSFHYSDQDSANPASVALQGMDVTLTDLGTRQGKPGRFSLAARMPDGTALAGEGELALMPFASSGVLRVTDMTPQAAWEFVDAQMRMAQPEARISAVLNYRLGTAPSLSLQLDAPELAVKALRLRKRDGAPPLLSLERITLPGTRVDLAQRMVSIPALDIADGAIAVGVDAKGVADWATLSADTPAQPAATPWQLDIGRLRIERLGFALTDASRQAPFGITFSNAQVQLALRARLGGTDTSIRIDSGSLGVTDAAMTTGAAHEAIARATTLRFDALEADVTRRRVHAARLTLDEVDTRLSRTADGNIRELALISTPNPDNPLPITSAALAWQIAVDEVGVTGLNAQLSDAATAPPVAYAIRDGALTVHNLSNAGTQPIRIAAKLPIEQGGDITVNGDAHTDGSAGSLKLQLKGLALLPLAPALDRYTTLALRAGALSGQSDLSWKGGANSATAVVANGDFDVDGLRMDESGSGDMLFAARRLAANGVEFGLGPDRLAIRDLRLDAPALKLVVFKDRSTNLGAIVRDAPAGDVAASASSDPFPITLERTRIRDATLDFADYSLVLPFATRIEGLKGSASEISSSATSRASLKFTGTVGPFGEAQIDGLMSPFDPARFTDIEVSFRNIALNSLSPYSATFAGRALDAGDIDLDLEYKVDNGTLAGDNRIVLQDLKLGDRVDSPSAEDLPLDLAIALLTDANGRIELSLPVSGNIGDPQYSYGSVVRRAIGNILKGVAAAPFRALGSLFGGNKSGDVGSLRFRSGSAELLPSERERVGKLVVALSERPRVAVSIPLGVEPKRDGYAIRRLAVRRAIADILGTELEPDEDPGPVSYVNAKSQHALEKLLEHREGKDASAAFARDYAKRVGREPERVNPALALFGHASEDAEFYRALYLYLVNSTPLPQEQLDALARARADAVAAECAARGFTADRVRVGAARTLQQARPSGVLLPLDLTSR